MTLKVFRCEIMLLQCIHDVFFRFLMNFEIKMESFMFRLLLNTFAVTLNFSLKSIESSNIYCSFLFKKLEVNSWFYVGFLCKDWKWCNKNHVLALITLLLMTLFTIGIVLNLNQYVIAKLLLISKTTIAHSSFFAFMKHTSML